MRVQVRRPGTLDRTNSSTQFAFFPSKAKRCTIGASPTPPRFRYFQRREGGGRELAENRVSARVFARSNPRRINQPRETSLLFEPTIPLLSLSDSVPTFSR